MANETETKTASLIFLLVVFTIMLTAGCGKKEEPVNPVATETAAVALKQDNAEKAQAAAERKRAELEAAEKAKVAAEKEAEKARLLAEQKALEDAERAKTLTTRLAAAEAEMDAATLNYNNLSEKAQELKKYLAVSQKNLRNLEDNLNILESKETATKTELNTVSSTLSTTTSRITQQQRSIFLQRQAVLNRELRSLTIKIGKAKNETDAEKTRISVREEELIQVESQLQEAQIILTSAKVNLDKIKNEAINS